MRVSGPVLALCLSGCLSGLPAFAEGLPVFDDSLGFDVWGTVSDGVIVSNGGAVFYCDIEEESTPRFFALTDCAPVIGPKAAIQARLAGAKEDEEALIKVLSRLAPEQFVPDVAMTFREFEDCVVNFEADEKVFLRFLAARVTETAGYTGPLTDELVEAISDITSGTGDLMVEQERVLSDGDDKTARLVNCP